MAKRKKKPTTVGEFLEQWPRAKRSTANAGTASIRIRGPKRQSPPKR
jgi:hypothetical protein